MCLNKIKMLTAVLKTTIQNRRFLFEKKDLRRAY